LAQRCHRRYWRKPGRTYENQSYEALPPAGKRDIAAYGLATDLDNNVYGLDNNLDQRQIWRTNAKTEETADTDLQLRVGGDSQNPQWFPQFHANRYAVYGSHEQQRRGARAVG